MPSICASLPCLVLVVSSALAPGIASAPTSGTTMREPVKSYRSPACENCILLIIYCLIITGTLQYQIAFLYHKKKTSKQMKIVEARWITNLKQIKGKIVKPFILLFIYELRTGARDSVFVIKVLRVADKKDPISCS